MLCQREQTKPKLENPNELIKKENPYFQWLRLLDANGILERVN